MTGFGPALRRELTGQVRTRRLLLSGVILVAFGLASPVFAKAAPRLVRLLPDGEKIAAALPPPSLTNAIDQTVKNLAQLAALLAVVTTMGLVARERDRGIAAILLTKPLSRSAYLLAKLLASGASLGAGLVAGAAGAFVYSALLFETPAAGGWLLLTGLLLVFLVFHVAVTLFASALTRSTGAAGGIAAGIAIFFALAGSLPGPDRYLPAGLLAAARTAAAGKIPDALPALAVTLALGGAFTLAAIAAFRRVEL